MSLLTDLSDSLTNNWVVNSAKLARQVLSAEAEADEMASSVFVAEPAQVR